MRGIDPRTSHMLSERSTTWATYPLPMIVSVNIKRLTFIHNDYDQIKKERNKVSETGLVNEAAMKPTKEMKYYQLMVAKTGGKIDGRKKLFSPAGNWTPVSRVTGGDTDHYTTEDLMAYCGYLLTTLNAWQTCEKHSMFGYYVLPVQCRFSSMMLSWIMFLNWRKSFLQFQNCIC